MGSTAVCKAALQEPFIGLRLHPAVLLHIFNCCLLRQQLLCLTQFAAMFLIALDQGLDTARFQLAKLFQALSRTASSNSQEFSSGCASMEFNGWLGSKSLAKPS